jgi:capping protein alpha
MSEETYPEASPSRKLDIATYFIMSAPTGEVDDVVADVTALVSDPSILNEENLTTILRDYNTEQFITANDPTTNAKVLITKFGQVEPNQYLDPNTGKILEFDHKKRTFTSETDKKQVLREDVESFRAAISKALETYVPTCYTKDKVTFAVYGADNGAINIVISSKNINLSNYWSGS